jgi:hypothetical protein
MASPVSSWLIGEERLQELQKARFLGIIALLAIILFSISSVRLAHSANESDQKAQEITLALKPLALVDYSSGPSVYFDVNATALNATYLHGFRMRLTYDAKLIECSAAQEGGLLRSFGNTTGLGSRIDNAVGYVYVSVNLTSPEAMANSSGSLVKLTFHVLSRGETVIQFEEVNLYDSNGAPLSYVTHNGYFNNRFLVDVAMPLTLLLVALAAMFLNRRTEAKLKTNLGERELTARDVIFLGAAMATVVSIIVFVPQMAIMALFLFSYSSLLFLISYVFSNHRWYVAIVPPAAFLLFYIFLRDTTLWSSYLVNVYGLVFAILIILYMGGIFTWKTTLIFGGIITALDIVLVLVTGAMITAFEQTDSLKLPVAIQVPIIPPIIVEGHWITRGLGLGDFFFAGLLAIQTWKRFGRKTALLSAAGMAISFFAFATFLLNYGPPYFPGTLMIICGWIPIALIGLRSRSGNR